MASERRKLKHDRPASAERIVFGRVIAERAYWIGRRTLRLEVGTPHEASWGGDFYCPFRIVEGRKTLVARHAFGVDAIQALQLVFTAAKPHIEALSPRIRWAPDAEPGDVGLDRLVPSGFGRKWQRRIDRLFDAEFLKMTRALERKAKRGKRAR